MVSCNGTPLQHSCLENPTDGGAWKAIVHGVAKGWTRLSNFTFTFHFHALEKEMATHSSVLAWRIPGTREPVGLPLWGRAASDTTEATQQQQLHLTIYNDDGDGDNGSGGDGVCVFKVGVFCPQVLSLFTKNRGTSQVKLYLNHYILMYISDIPNYVTRQQLNSFIPSQEYFL